MRNRSSVPACLAVLFTLTHTTLLVARTTPASPGEEFCGWTKTVPSVPSGLGGVGVRADSRSEIGVPSFSGGSNGSSALPRDRRSIALLRRSPSLAKPSAARVVAALTHILPSVLRSEWPQPSVVGPQPSLPKPVLQLRLSKVSLSRAV